MSPQLWATSFNARARAWRFFFVAAIAASAGVASETKPAWSIRDGLSNPSSAYFDSQTGYLFVANSLNDSPGKAGSGWISQHTIQGRPVNSKWLEGLHAPAGMRSHRGILWIVDGQDLVQVDLTSGKMLRRITIQEARTLSDVAIGPKGEIYASERDASKIYTYQENKIEVFAGGNELESPSGLLVVGDRLYVSAWGSNSDLREKTFGGLYWLDLRTRKRTNVTSQSLGNLRGLEMDGSRNFWVADQNTGKIFRVSPEGRAEEKFVSFRGPADIGWIVKQNLIVVPQMMENTLSAFPAL